MKFSKKNLPKTTADLEQFVKIQGLRPVEVVPYKGIKIFLAETDLETDRPFEYNWGYYQTSWFINSTTAEDRFEGGSWVEFDAMHDSNAGWTPETKRQARINAALAQAQDFINKSLETGLLNA